MLSRIILWNGPCKYSTQSDMILNYWVLPKNYIYWFYYRDEDGEEMNGQMPLKGPEQMTLGANPFLDVPVSTNAIEYKKGYVMRKCCYEANAKKSEYYVKSLPITEIKSYVCTLEVHIQ